MRWLAALLVLVLGFAAYVRLAPSDPARWHRIPADAATGDGTYLATLEGVSPDTLARLTAIALATPRTTMLAGTPQDGLVTVITRTKLWGFPDYSTFQQAGDRLTIFARLRFGGGDLGVNKARVEAWLAALANS